MALKGKKIFKKYMKIREKKKLIHTKGKKRQMYESQSKKITMLKNKDK